LARAGGSGISELRLMARRHMKYDPRTFPADSGAIPCGSRENREERAALLAEADPEMRREVESLLAQRGGEFLDRPAIQNAPQLLEDSTLTGLAVGARLGPYRIESKLGEGGMGFPRCKRAGVCPSSASTDRSSLQGVECTRVQGDELNRDARGVGPNQPGRRASPRRRCADLQASACAVSARHDGRRSIRHQS
jgi:hypothetical protein